MRYNHDRKEGSQQAQAKIMIDEDGMIVVVLVILGSVLGVFAPSIIGHFWPYGVW